MIHGQQKNSASISLSAFKVFKQTILLTLLVLLANSCSYHPASPSYNNLYKQLELIPECTNHSMRETDFFLIFLVDARRLDYTNNRSLCRTLAKHPSDGSKNGDVGHAWIYLQGSVNGEKVVVEGGHSGETGLSQPKYFDGVMNNIEYGTPDPTSEQKHFYRKEPNPIKYLWASQCDGFFQKGSGNHIPTFAAKIDLTESQFLRILEFIKNEYHYRDYAITRNQCTSFVAQIGALANFSMTYKITIPIDQTITMGGKTLTLWEDPNYSMLTLPSPDILEQSLIQSVGEGKAEYALPWYRAKHPKSQKACFNETWQNAWEFPSRLKRYLLF